MSGLFALLFGGAVAVSGIKHAMDDSWCKQNLRKTLPNGMEYYTDADGKDRLMDDSLIVKLGFGDNLKVVRYSKQFLRGLKREVIYDAKKEIEIKTRNYVKELNEERKSLPLYIAISDIYYRYDKDMKCNYGFFERETGKEIIKLKSEMPRCKKYYKYYVKQITHNELIHSGTTDKATEITEDEYKSLYEGCQL